MRFLKLYLIGLGRLWWMRGLIGHDDYDWLLSVIRAEPKDIYESPFFE